LPETVYLLLQKNKPVAMASYNAKIISGFPSIIVEGIAVDPKFQGRGVFRELTSLENTTEAVILLRTQSPRMYAALANYCSFVHPTIGQMPEAVRGLQKGFAAYLNCNADQRGIVRGHYGGLLYGTEPQHTRFSKLLKKDLGMKLHKGDAALLVGIR
jgi:hypothetical protein